MNRDKLPLWIALAAAGFLLVLGVGIYVGHKIEPNQPATREEPFSLEGQAQRQALLDPAQPGASAKP